MEPVKFTILFESPIGLTADLQNDLYCWKQPRYRILGLELSRVNSNTHELTVQIHPEDIHPKKTDPHELYDFRDRLLSLIAITAMVPVRMRSQGVFTFDLGEGKYEARSLGPMSVEESPIAIPSLRPLIDGPSLPRDIAAAIRLIWQAINTDEPLYRFINIAICIELLAGTNSPEPRSVNPHCANSRCRFILEHCPECEKPWTIPNSLRNTARFLITDEGLLKRFIRARNKVFHGATHQRESEFLSELSALNIPLLVTVRNYVGDKIGLEPIEEEALSIVVQGFRMRVSVYYSMPDTRAKES